MINIKTPASVYIKNDCEMNFFYQLCQQNTDTETPNFDIFSLFLTGFR